ncbi:MAG: PH domain-containing protein, partial [Duncaniella dubosii]|nr:PH domain-containing protein [Duncaniella dubosii]
TSRRQRQLCIRDSHITLKDSYLIVNNGRFAETKNYLKYDNIEVVRVTRTPLSRFTGRVSLSLSTTGTTFTVRSLRQEQAMNIYELLLAKPQK